MAIKLSSDIDPKKSKIKNKKKNNRLYDVTVTIKFPAHIINEQDNTAIWTMVLRMLQHCRETTSSVLKQQNIVIDVNAHKNTSKYGKGKPYDEGNFDIINTNGNWIDRDSILDQS